MYEFAGGAPIVVTDPSHVTGEPTGTLPEIDQTAIDDAGSGGAFNHIRQYPADGTFVTATFINTTITNDYEFVGGARVHVSDFSTVGGQPDGPVASIDQTALDNAGTGGAFNHVRPFPADGTCVAGMASGGTPVADYVFAGGAPIPITDWTHLGGPAPGTPPAGTSIVNVDESALDTVIESFGTGHLFVIAAGAPLRVTSLEAIDPSTAGLGPAPSIAAFVDQDALDKAGSGGFWNHLNFKPADNTLSPPPPPCPAPTPGPQL